MRVSGSSGTAFRGVKTRLGVSGLLRVCSWCPRVSRSTASPCYQCHEHQSSFQISRPFNPTAGLTRASSATVDCVLLVSSCNCNRTGETRRSTGAVPLFVCDSSTCAIERFRLVNSGEGSSFLGDGPDSKTPFRLTGVESAPRLRDGDKHALADFSPRIRRPSLAGLGLGADRFICEVWDA